ncbi:MAG: BamA/TamA family outer membrane protein, partial [Acidobacteriia bacterium]|nr:BamA/TamA family outer membrane protein [Terriglobia bacterium]
PGITLSPSNRDNTPGLGITVGYDTRDSWTNPHVGFWNDVELVKYGGVLGSRADYWTLNMDLRRYQPLHSKHRMALFSLTTLQSGAVGADVPVYRDFHLGGSNTIRGWSLGSRHGKNQSISTAEYRYEVIPPRSFKVKGIGLYAGLQLAAFGDAGTAWDAGSQFTRNFIGSGGMGLRILLPFIDMIRVDAALGQRGEGWKFHIGLRDKPINQRRRVR